jgi:peptide/nickel transport system substrate-binding protein
MKRFFVSVAWILSFLLFAPPKAAESASDQAKRGGTLTVGTQKDLTVMNPLVRTSSTDKYLRQLMFEPLLAHDAKGKIQPFLAESWEISADGRLYTFRLRKGVKFHNGQEMTADDVQFAIGYTLNPKNGAYGLSALDLVERAQSVDRYTLTIAVKRTSSAFLAALSDIQSFSVIPKGSLKDGTSKPGAFPPGTGPFRFAEWQPNQRLVLESFDGYWGSRPFVDRLVMRPIPDNTVRFAALRSGDVDIIERAPYEWLKQIMEGKVKGVVSAAVARSGFRHIVLNVAAPPFNNKKLRQAVAHAIDKQQILHAAYFGFGEPADQVYPEGYLWYFEEVRSPKRDLSKAKALVKESGYRGEPIKLSLRQGDDQQTEALTLQSQLKEIGVQIVLDNLEYGAYTARQRSGEFALRFSGGGFELDPSATYGSDFTCEPDPGKRAANASGYCDREMDSLIKQAEIEMNLEKRRDLFRKIVSKINDDLPIIPIGYAPRFFVARDHVRGFSTDSRAHFRHFEGGLTHTWLDR